MRRGKRGGVGLLMGLLLAVALPAAGEEAVRLGLLLPYTGVLQLQGVDSTRGVELYLKEIGGAIDGHPVEVIKEDTQAKPDLARSKVKKLVERDRVHFLIGPVSSASALAIQDYVCAQQTPLIIPTAFTKTITLPERACAPIFRIIETTEQSNYPFGQWVFAQTGYRTLAVVASNFAAGRDAADGFMRGFGAAGGTIGLQIYPPLGTPDFGPFLSQLAAARVDAVYAWVAGADAIRFVKQYAAFGLRQRLPLLGYDTVVDDPILPSLGEAALGIVSVGHWGRELDDPVSRAFVQRYEAEYGEAPTRYSESGYAAAQLVVTAVRALRGALDDPARVLAALRQVAPAVRAPRGPLKFDAYQQVITNIYVMRVEQAAGGLRKPIIATIPEVSQFPAGVPPR